jgi:hypothetical protein
MHFTIRKISGHNRLCLDDHLQNTDFHLSSADSRTNQAQKVTENGNIYKILKLKHGTRSPHGHLHYDAQT